MTLEFNYQEIFNLEYSIVPAGIKTEVMEAYLTILDEEIITEAFASEDEVVKPIVNYLEGLVNLGLSEEELNNRIDIMLEGLSENSLDKIYDGFIKREALNILEGYINEVSMDYVQQKAQNVLKQRKAAGKPVGLVGINKIHHAQEVSDKIDKIKSVAQKVAADRRREADIRTHLATNSRVAKKIEAQRHNDSVASIRANVDADRAEEVASGKARYTSKMKPLDSNKKAQANKIKFKKEKKQEEDVKPSDIKGENGQLKLNLGGAEKNNPPKKQEESKVEETPATGEENNGVIQRKLFKFKKNGEVDNRSFNNKTTGQNLPKQKTPKKPKRVVVVKPSDIKGENGQLKLNLGGAEKNNPPKKQEESKVEETPATGEENNGVIQRKLFKFKKNGEVDNRSFNNKTTGQNLPKQKTPKKPKRVVVVRSKGKTTSTPSTDSERIKSRKEKIKKISRDAMDKLTDSALQKIIDDPELQEFHLQAQNILNRRKSDEEFAKKRAARAAGNQPINASFIPTLKALNLIAESSISDESFNSLVEMIINKDTVEKVINKKQKELDNTLDRVNNNLRFNKELSQNEKEFLEKKGVTLEKIKQWAKDRYNK